MIAIRVCPICKKVCEGRGGVSKVYCDECTMLEDFATSDEARAQSSWFFEDSEDSEKEDSGMHETGQEKLLDPLTDESRLPAAPRQTKESLLYLITPRKKYRQQHLNYPCNASRLIHKYPQTKFVYYDSVNI